MRNVDTNPAIAFFHRHKIKGFLDDEEGLALYQLALDAAASGPCLEIGSYCGRSSVFLGLACKKKGNTLFSVDHHRGSEEHQLGEYYHDKDLYDSKQQQIDSFPYFRQTLKLAGLEQTVVPLVAASKLVAKHWRTPLGLVFVDGGHSPHMSREDCLMWAEKVSQGGFLAIHDIFEKPEEGGQGPFLAMRALLDTGNYQLLKKVRSLGILTKLNAGG